MSTQLVVYLFTKLADAAIVWFSKDSPERRASISSSVVSGNQPSSMPDQPLRDVSTADDHRSPLPEPTCLPQRFHGGPECKLPQVPGFDDCVAVRVLAKFDALWRSLLTSPAISLLVHHPRATQHQCDPHVSSVCTTAPIVATEESFVDCIAITAPV